MNFAPYHQVREPPDEAEDQARRDPDGGEDARAAKGVHPQALPHQRVILPIQHSPLQVGSGFHLI